MARSESNKAPHSDLPTQRLNLSSVALVSLTMNLGLVSSFPASPLCKRYTQELTKSWKEKNYIDT